MEADLLGSLATGDSGPEVPVTQPLKREQDSVDDFEHLEREGKREESPFHHPAAARTATQGFLDTEREELFVDTPRAPSAADKLSDHLADKFTDSESEVSASESPLHRPEPPPHARPGAPTPEPASLLDTAPFHDTLPADPIKPDPIPEVKPEPKPAPAPAVEVKPVVPEHAPAKPAPAPAPAKEPAPQPKPAAKEPEASRTTPVAHVIEAEVIFCQMGLDDVTPFSGIPSCTQSTQVAQDAGAPGVSRSVCQRDACAGRGAAGAGAGRSVSTRVSGAARAPSAAAQYKLRKVQTWHPQGLHTAASSTRRLHPKGEWSPWTEAEIRLGWRPGGPPRAPARPAM
ncbi:unnamed protein product [Plutella xylostella]|uniref:(diamondback moth) hypothetical protein n=1 Tax=Plutella xylostella TaxID=51655 RepID=A0A8S4EEI2_PLUXY|nr:unnamed protein product [Plutella xylostella]